MLAGWRKIYSDPVTHPWIAADFNHYAEKFGKGMVRIGYADLNVLLTHWRKAVVPADCLTSAPVSP